MVGGALSEPALCGMCQQIPMNPATASGSTNPIDLTTDPTNSTPPPTQQFSADPPETPPDQGRHPPPTQDHIINQVEPLTVPDQGGQSQHGNIDVPC